MDIEKARHYHKATDDEAPYKAKDGEEYVLNLIDTLDVDFNYEVSRSLRWCRTGSGCTQGVGGADLGNVYLALDEDLEILPVLNKMDLDSARPEGGKG